MLFWSAGAIQIRTFYIVKSNGLCAVFIVECNDDFIVIRLNSVDKRINEHFTMCPLSHIQLAETMKPEGCELRCDFWPDKILAGNLDFQILFNWLQVLQAWS